MNIFIVVVCVNLLTLVIAGHNINFETILKILKDKPRKSGFSNHVETSDPDEMIPILPGFYLEKPKDLSKTLFKNPKAWPDDIYAILNKEERERNKPKVNVNTEIKTSEDEYLQGKLLKAVEDLKKYRASQTNVHEKFDKIQTYHECDDDLTPMSGKKFKARHIDSENAKKDPVKKLLGRVFEGMNSGIYYKGGDKNKKPKTKTGAKNVKTLGELLKKILNGNINNQPNRESVQHAYAKTEEESQSKEELLGNILNAIQYNDPGRESETDLHPSMVIISPASFDNDDYEVENNAQEETSDEDYSSSDSQNLYNTRRKNDPDIGSKKDSINTDSSSESGSSDYERNPGNPFTVHKNKYKQNWPYNHFMDGDHMNINPFGPKFGSLGPSGPELFFGRKWWYFNQDDYKPMA